MFFRKAKNTFLEGQLTVSSAHVCWTVENGLDNGTGMEHLVDGGCCSNPIDCRPASYVCTIARCRCTA